MPTQDELGSYAILLGGGILIVGGLTLLAKQPREAFVLAGQVCSAAAVRQWLQLKVSQGKITQDDVNRLLNSSADLEIWLKTVFSSRGFNLSDVAELNGLC